MKKILSILFIISLLAATAHALILGPSGASTVTYAPNAPTLSSVSSASSTSLSLVWSYGATDASHSAATSVSVYRGTSAGAESGTPVATGVTTSPWADTGLTTGQAYYYYLRGVNTTGPSVAASNEMSGTPTATVYAPNAPTIGTATAGNASASVAFTPGVVDGLHSAATSYTATSSPGSITGTGASSPISVTGLTNGTPYTFTVTASNSAGTSSASAASSPAVTPSAGGAGLLDFETASLTPSGLSPAYTNMNTSNVVRSTTVAHGGTYSMKFTSVVTPWPGIYRQVNFPSSGTVSFERWFNAASLSSPRGFSLFGVSPDVGISDWTMDVYVQKDGAKDGLCYYSPTYQATVVYPLTSMTANTWYRVKVDVNADSNTYAITLYNATGTQLANVSALPLNIGTVSGQSMYIWTGVEHSAETVGQVMYIDDLTDGI